MYYLDEFDQRQRIYFPSNPELQKRLLHIYHDSAFSMHRGRDATNAALSRNFYWKSMSKHVKTWVQRRKHCLRFKSIPPKHGPMQVCMYQCPFETLGELPVSSSGIKYILTVVCPFSNFLIRVPLPDKTATTVSRILLNHIFYKFGFPEVIQSDRGTEFPNAILFRITKLLSIKHVFTTSYRPIIMLTKNVRRCIPSFFQ